MKKIYFILLLSLAFAAGCKDDAPQVDENCAECKINSLNKEEAEKYLTAKLLEIQNLTVNIPCTDASKWSIVPIGAKACGGPAGYVVNHTSLDQQAFTDKVVAYTAAQIAFNKKFSIISDCGIVNIPQNVECANGKPRFY